MEAWKTDTVHVHSNVSKLSGDDPDVRIIVEGFPKAACQRASDSIDQVMLDAQEARLDRTRFGAIGEVTEPSQPPTRLVQGAEVWTFAHAGASVDDASSVLHWAAGKAAAVMPARSITACELVYCKTAMLEFKRALRATPGQSYTLSWSKSPSVQRDQIMSGAGPVLVGFPFSTPDPTPQGAGDFVICAVAGSTTLPLVFCTLG